MRTFTPIPSVLAMYRTRPASPVSGAPVGGGTGLAVAGTGGRVDATVTGTRRTLGGAAGPVPAAPRNPRNDATPPSRIRPPTRAATVRGIHPTGRRVPGPCCMATPVAPG